MSRYNQYTGTNCPQPSRCSTRFVPLDRGAHDLARLQQVERVHAA